MRLQGTRGWTDGDLKQAFDRYVLEHGRLPTAPEVDLCPYLPSARQIQRRFGGLRQLRERLGYEDVDFGRGTFRSQFADANTKRGLLSELELEKELYAMFGEIYVHTEKRYGKLGRRLDFFVFTPDGNFGVDVFYAETLRDIQKNLNHKADKYEDFQRDTELFFVVGHDLFSEEEITATTENMSKLSKLPQLQVVGMRDFLATIRQRKRYADPPGYKPAVRD